MWLYAWTTHLYLAHNPTCCLMLQRDMSLWSIKQQVGLWASPWHKALLASGAAARGELEELQWMIRQGYDFMIRAAGLQTFMVQQQRVGS